MLNVTTPNQVTPEVLAFCSELAAGQTPVSLQVRTDPAAVKGECFTNVRAQQKMHGGCMQLGWIIWECPKLFLEAEFHAVWADSNGVLTDVTPKIDGETEILYLPDPNATYSFEEDVVPKNRRLALVDHADVKEYLRLCTERDDIVEKYKRKPPMDAIADIEIAKIQVGHKLRQEFGLPGGEGADPFTSLLERLRPKAAPVQTFHRESPKVGRNDPCPCGSGKKFKKCCG